MLSLKPLFVSFKKQIIQTLYALPKKYNFLFQWRIRNVLDISFDIDSFKAAQRKTLIFTVVIDYTLYFKVNIKRALNTLHIYNRKCEVLCSSARYVMFLNAIFVKLLS